jgi:hypothetical protein
MEPIKYPRGLKAQFENIPTNVGEERKMSDDETDGKDGSEFFHEESHEDETGGPEGETGTPEYETGTPEAGPDEGFGNPGAGDAGQQQNQQLDADGEFEDEPSVSETDIQNMARDKVMDEEVKRLLGKYIPGLDHSETMERKTDVEELKRDADHLGLRILDAKDISHMSPNEVEAYHKKLETKCGWYDFFKKYIGINPYSWQFRWKLRRARKVKSRLERNIEVFERELSGNGYISRGSSLYREVLQNLPEAMREEREISSVIDFMSEKNKRKLDREGGLKALKRDLKEKGRTYKAVRALARNNVRRYEGRVKAAKDRIRKINEATKNTDKIEEQQKLIQESMGLTGELCTYERERDKWSSLYEFVTDDVLGIKAEYDLASIQISLRKTTIDTTREALRELNIGIKQLENFVKAKRDMVVMGDHIVDVTYAKDISTALVLGGYVMTEAAVQMLYGITDQMKRGIRGSVTEAGRKRVNEVSSAVNSYKEEKANQFEEMLEDAFID